MQRYNKVIRPGLKKGKWKKEEDELLLSLVKVKGTGNWHEIAEYMGGRSASQCKERFTNYLDPHWDRG